MDFATAWQFEATKDEEKGTGDHDDLPNFMKNFQLRKLHEQSQPLDQLDKVVEEI
jgi:hypothetical protein